ncbi:MAG: hypothetical protein Q7W30_04345 [Coriobacteriia bacterium]|nr:hypothetical protein [Coriobacteriia bacterium]
MSDAPASKANPARTLVTIIMDLLVVVAVVLLAHLVIVFFGQLASQPWAEGVVRLTSRLIAPLGVAAIKTPYGGIFDVNAALTILIVLGGEWILGTVRRTV